jgi:hypothetical protein
VRNIILDDESTLSEPAVVALIDAALEHAGWRPAGDVDGPVSIRAEGGPRRPRRIEDRG